MPPPAFPQRAARWFTALFACAALLLIALPARAGGVEISAEGSSALHSLTLEGPGTQSSWDGGDGDFTIRILARGGRELLDLSIDTEAGKVTYLVAEWTDPEGTLRKLHSRDDAVKVSLKRARVARADLALRLTFSGRFTATGAEPRQAEVRLDLTLPRMDFAPTPPDPAPKP